MVYAQIKNGRVFNTIVTDETTPLDLFARGFDYFLRIDTLSSAPSIGWIYDGKKFLPPPDLKGMP